MSSHIVVHHNVARIDSDDELQGEVRLLIERVDQKVAQWAKEHPAGTPAADRPPLILLDVDLEPDA